MTARMTSIAVGVLRAGLPALVLALVPAAHAKPTNAKAAKGAATANQKPGAKVGAKADTSANIHNAAPPGAETGIPEAQRLAIQADLVWLYSYGEMGAEEINARLVEQIKAFQRRNNGKDTGVLSDQERAALADAVKTKQAAAGWRLIDDTATGARLGVPEKLTPKASAARTGSRWSSAGGQVLIETFRLREASLPVLFDQEKRSARREIGASSLEPDSFVITGQQGLKKFVERAQSRGGEVRGVTMLYDQATEGTMAPVAIAVADTFDGFPDPTLAAAGRKRGVEYGSAVVVSSSGDLVTTADLADDCRAITVPGYGHAVWIAADDSNDLALLRLYGARGLVPPAFADNTDARSKLTLWGIGDPAGGDSDNQVTHTTATLTDQGLDPLPKLGFSGGAAADAQGRLTGLIAIKAAVVAGSAAAPQATLIPAATVRAFLQAQDVVAAAGQPVGDPSVVRIICVRK